VRIIVYNCRTQHNTAQNSSDNSHSYPLYNHHSSDDVYWSWRATIIGCVSLHIPGLGEVRPENHHFAAENHLTVLVPDVAVVTAIRSAKHVVDFEAVKGFTRPRRPQVARGTVIEGIHEHLALALQQ